MARNTAYCSLCGMGKTPQAVHLCTVEVVSFLKGVGTKNPAA